MKTYRTSFYCLFSTAKNDIITLYFYAFLNIHDYYRPEEKKMSEDKEGYLIDYISGVQLKATPEEEQAVQPFTHKLVEDYGYPPNLIQTRPQWRVKVRPSDTKKEYPVDIAVFKETAHEDDSLYMIVECKKKTWKKPA